MSSVSVEFTTPEGSRPIALVRMDDGKANVLNAASLGGLVSALDAVDAGDCCAAVIVGRPGFFSGGLDLKELPKLPTAEKREVLTRFGEVLLRVFTLKVPTIAAVSGHAIAGGALLALATDVRFGADSAARFGVTEVAIGLPIPTFGVLLARAALAPPVLTEVVLHGRVLGLREAAARGVIRELHADEALLGAALAWAAEVGKIDGPSYLGTKRELWGREVDALRAGLGDEVARFCDLFERRFPGSAAS